MPESRDEDYNLDIVCRGEARAEIVVGPKPGEVIRNAALTLRQEIRRRTGAELPILARPSKASRRTVIYLATLDGHPGAKDALARLGHEPAISTRPGREGFMLVSGRLDGMGTVVIDGSDDLGTFHGVGWLLRKMRFSEVSAVVSGELDISTAPATWQRRIRFGDHFGYVNTELEGWREIWADYVLWGLSTVTMRCDPAHQGDPRETHLAEYLWNKWAERVPLARALGLEVVHLTQATLAAKDGEFGPTRIPDFEELNYMCFDFNGVNPKFARGREVLHRFRKWFFDNMPHVKDVNYLMNGFDGGGCFDPEVAPWSCTYADLVDQIIHPLLEEHNPDVQIILSLYACPGSYLLATKVQQGWKPSWLAAIEFDDPDIAPLFPKDIRRVYFGMWITDFHTGGYYQTVGVNPCPKLCEAMFNHIWHDCEIRDGLGNYSEGPHDFINQIVMMQLAWDPNRDVDGILDDLCCYYFGETAAPLLKEAFYLMEEERPHTVAEGLADPKVNPRIRQLLEQAEGLMPEWALRSRQWALVRGRAGIVQARRRQADLVPTFDEHWRRYQSLVEDGPSEKYPDWADESREYFQSLVDSGQQMVAVFQRMQRDGFGVIGGGQMALYPNPLTGAAAEALASLQDGQRGSGSVAPGRWCIAHLDVQGRVTVSDGWSNRIILEQGPVAADAQLAFADPYGSGSARIVYLGVDGRLYSWSPVEDLKLLAEGQFLTGPLAAGDLDEDGRDELVVLAGSSAEEGCLAVVNGAGNVRLLQVRPSGLAPEAAAEGVFPEAPIPKQAARIAFEPRVRICDLDGDGHLELVCADRDDAQRLVVLDSLGNRKAVGPVAPAGAIATGDLNGDGMSEVVFVDSEMRLGVYSLQHGVLRVCEPAVPRWTSAVAVVRMNGQRVPGVVYADAGGMLRVIHLGGESRALTDQPSSVAVGPGMVVGDYNGDGRDEVCYLRRRLAFHFPLSTLSLVDGSGGLRDIPLGNWYFNRRQQSYGAPLGPRASGRLRFPTIEFAWDADHGFRGYRDYPFSYVFGALRFVPDAFPRRTFE